MYKMLNATFTTNTKNATPTNHAKRLSIIRFLYFTFKQLQVGYSLALFQLSTLISVFLGYRYFQEGNIRRRLLGSLVMVVGAALIVTLGQRSI